MTSGFEQPDIITPKLTWSKDQLFVELSFPPKWTQEVITEKLVTQCQVRFQGNGQIFCSEVSPVSALYHVDRKSPVTWFLPLLSVGLVGNCHYAASVRLGNDHVWSDWSDWGGLMATTLPKIWSRDQLVLATKPMNCKVKLDWQQLCCDLGSIPIECVISMKADQQETLIAMTSCTAQNETRSTLRDRLEVAINGFDPGETYQFILHARAHVPLLGGRQDAETLSKMEFQEVARSETFQWPMRLSEEWSCMVDWSLPLPRSAGQIQAAVIRCSQ